VDEVAVAVVTVMAAAAAAACATASVGDAARSVGDAAWRLVGCVSDLRTGSAHSFGRRRLSCPALQSSAQLSSSSAAASGEGRGIVHAAMRVVEERR